MDSVTTLINESKTEVDGPTFVECPFLIHKKQEHPGEGRAKDYKLNLKCVTFTYLLTSLNG